MGYKTVKALAAATIPLSIGMFRFEPEGEDERYHGGVFSEEDANKIVAKGIGKITGDASKEDWGAFFASLSGDAPGVNRRIDNYLKANKKPDDEEGEGEAEEPTLSKAAATSRMRAHSDDAGPASSGGVKGVRAIKDELRETADPDVIAKMLEDEKAGANRSSAIAAIEARARAVAAGERSADEDSDEGEGDDGAGEQGPATTTGTSDPAPASTNPSEPAQTPEPAPAQPNPASATQPAGGAQPASGDAAEGSEQTQDSVEGAGAVTPDPDAAPVS